MKNVVFMDFFFHGDPFDHDSTRKIEPILDSSLAAAVLGVQPSVKPHDLSEHVSGAGRQTRCGVPTVGLAIQSELHKLAAELPHQPGECF